jgi:plastocyanin
MRYAETAKAISVAVGAVACSWVATDGGLAAGPGFAKPSSSTLQTLTYRQGPFRVAPYEVATQNKYPRLRTVPSPPLDGFIVRMHARVVDGRGRRIPVRRLMLHHVLFRKLIRERGGAGLRRQGFYGTGEEDQALRLPPGYGYPIRKGDRWLMGWMLMNHRRRSDSAYIEFEVTIDRSPHLKPVTPYWLSVAGYHPQPIFDVPGGGPPGSTYTMSSSWTLPEGGLLVAAGGHAHGGSKDLEITQPSCGNRVLMASSPLYGLPDHPVYKVRPVLHEPGPADMSWTQTAAGIPVGKGETLKVSSHYDAERLHTSAMGIMHAYVHHDPRVSSSCAPLPADLVNESRQMPGRAAPPRVSVPLTALDWRGRARTISRPPGPRRRYRGDATVAVRELAFNPRNLSVPLGALVRWRFADGRRAHAVTVANGPEGFSSQPLRGGGSFEYRLDRAGIYRIFCSLHPVDMTQSIVVRRTGAKLSQSP